MECDTYYAAAACFLFISGILGSNWEILLMEDLSATRTKLNSSGLCIRTAGLWFHPHTSYRTWGTCRFHVTHGIPTRSDWVGRLLRTRNWTASGTRSSRPSGQILHAGISTERLRNATTTKKKKNLRTAVSEPRSQHDTRPKRAFTQSFYVLPLFSNLLPMLLWPSFTHRSVHLIFPLDFDNTVKNIVYSLPIFSHTRYYFLEKANIFLPSILPYQLWGPPTLLPNGCRGGDVCLEVKRSGRGAEHSSSSNVKVNKNLK